MQFKILRFSNASRCEISRKLKIRARQFCAAAKFLDHNSAQ